MATSTQSTAAVIGSGPNGLAAAILLARAGRSVTVYEAAPTIGGGARTDELTLPGFLHDVCSAIHPMAISSPCFEKFPLAQFGLEWIHPSAPAAHPLDDGTAVMLERSLDETAANLGPDGAAWRRLFHPIAAHWGELRHDLLGPIGPFPRHPLLMAAFGRHAIRSARGLASSHFRGTRARALFSGIAAHSVIPLEDAPSAAAGLLLGAIAHAGGWPMPRGGAQAISNALAGYFRSLGGRILTDSRIELLPDAPLVFCDITPRQLLRLSDQFRPAYKDYRYGPGVFKLDYAIDGPIPWRAPECLRAGTVHLGGTFDEVAQWEATHTGQPFVLLAQQSLFDPTRAPAGKHTVWAYCHVPNGSNIDFTGAIEDQIERFAPGFRDRILARHALTPFGLEARNANLVGGDIGGGSMDFTQFFFRPRYKTPVKGVYLCSSSTPPAGGVHGMCGYHAVKTAGFRV